LENLIELKDLSKYYHSGDVVTLGLRKINLSFHKGEFVAVVGESGSGKSTLMNVISGTDTYEEGEMLYAGEETSCYTTEEWVRYRKENVSFVFQDYNLIDSYTVLQNVELALYDSIPDKKERKKRATELIEKVGLSSHIRHRCTKLSGGQKQRVAIARALAKDTPILIADEPTGNLDEATGKAIIKLLYELSRDKLLIMVTHTFDDVEDYATRRIRLYDGTVIEDKEVKESDYIENNEKITVTESKGKQKLQRLKNLLNISFNNVMSTPKKSIMVFSTAFITSGLLLFFLICYNVLVFQNQYSEYRRDSAIIYTSERIEFDEPVREDLLSIEGVDAVMLHYSLNGIRNYGGNIIKNRREKGGRVLNIKSYNKNYVEYGTLPKNKGEILVGFYYDDDPNLDAIGKEFNFQSYYGVEKTFKITGFTTGEGIFMLTEDIEELSIEENIKKAENTRININLYDSETLLSGSLNYTVTDVILDESVTPGEAVIIFNDEEEYDRTNPYFSFLDFFDTIDASEKNGNIRLSQDFYAELYLIKISTENVNSELYNTYYEDELVVVMNPADCEEFPLHPEKTNSAMIAFDENYEIENTIERLKDEGYKVLYQYNAAPNPYQIQEAYISAMMFFFSGIFIVALGAIFISTILTRILKTKKKDYNILRTLGYPLKSVKTVSYFEILTVNIAAFIIMTLIIYLVDIFSFIFKSYRTLNFLYIIFPYGLFHYMTAKMFLTAFFMLLMLTVLIIIKFNKKLFSKSIKSSSIAE